MTVAEDQTTRPSWIIGVALKDFSFQQGMLNFLDGNFVRLSLIFCMSSKLILFSPNSRSNPTNVHYCPLKKRARRGSNP